MVQALLCLRKTLPPIPDLPGQQLSRAPSRVEERAKMVAELVLRGVREAALSFVVLPETIKKELSLADLLSDQLNARLAPYLSCSSCHSIRQSAPLLPSSSHCYCSTAALKLTTCKPFSPEKNARPGVKDCQRAKMLTVRPLSARASPPDPAPDRPKSEDQCNSKRVPCFPTTHRG